jgi:hypothetical protein
MYVHFTLPARRVKSVLEEIDMSLTQPHRGGRDDTIVISEALWGFLDLLVKTSLERVEGERLARGQGPGVFDRKGAANYLAIGTTTLDGIRSAGELKPIKIRGVPKYTRAELDRYIRKQEKLGR